MPIHLFTRCMLSVPALGSDANVALPVLSGLGFLVAYRIEGKVCQVFR